MGWANKATIAAGVLLVAVVMAYVYDGVDLRSDISFTQNYLRLYGSSIYGSATPSPGSEPTKLTISRGLPLARRNIRTGGKSTRHWGGCHRVAQRLTKPDSKENARSSHSCPKHNKGLDAEMGRMWVCWGDLRTECITPEELRSTFTKLQALILSRSRLHNGGNHFLANFPDIFQRLAESRYQISPT